MSHNRRNILKLGVAGTIAGCTAGFGGFAHAQATITARIGHLEAPTQPRHKGLEKVAALVKERTKGAIEIALYPSSQLGNARQMIESTQFGAIEGTVMPAAFLGGFNPVISVLDIPVPVPDRPRGVAEAARGSVRQGAARELRDARRGRAHHLAERAQEHHLEQAARQPRRLQGAEIPRDGFQDPDRAIRRGRRDRDRDQFLRALHLAADRPDRRAGESARHHHDDEIPRGAEAHGGDRARRDGGHRPVQQYVLEQDHAGAARRSSPRRSTRCGPRSRR